MKSSFYSLITISILLSGCTNTQTIIPNNQEKTKKNVFTQSSVMLDEDKEYFYDLNDVIINIADQLLDSNTIKTKPTSIILTSFVDLNSLESTDSFGRIISESMFNELHIRKFKVTDFRGQDAVSVNPDGEFHITRDIEKLKDNIEAIEYILVGTYTAFENESLLVNGRIIDSISGEVISSARVIYKPKDCKFYDICQKDDKKMVISKEKQPEIINQIIENNQNDNNQLENKTIVKEPTLAPIEIIKDN